MPKFAIHRDAKIINKNLNRQAKIGGEYYTLLHQNAIDVLVHANEHGSISQLNRFYHMLRENDRQAFKNYVARFQTTKIDGKVTLTERAFLKFENNEFRIDTSTPVEQRRAGSPFVKHVEDVLLNPDGKTSKPFYDQDNVADAKMQLFDDTNILEGIQRLVKAAQADDTDKRKVMVSSPFVQFLKEMERKAEDLANKLNVTEVHQSNVVQLESRRAPAETPAETSAPAKSVDEDTKTVAAKGAKPAPANGRRRRHA